MTPVVLWRRLRERGVVRVAGSYAVIAWLALQIADVTLEPMGAPAWTMRALITLALIGAPLVTALAWFFELTPAGVARDTAADAVVRPAVHGWRRYADVVFIGVLVSIVAVLLMREAGWLRAGPRFAEASLAVLPFTNLGDESSEYLSAGFEDELRSQLGRVEGLRVIARSSSHAVTERKRNAVASAKTLGIAAIVEGSLRRDGGQLRISVQLVDGRDGSVVWSADYDRGLSEMLTVQSAVAAEIVRAVMPKFLAEGGTVPSPGTSSVSAQDLYLIGRQYERDRSPANLQKARELYEAAIAADPRYATAHASLGRVVAFLNRDMARELADEFDALVLPHLDRALELDRLCGQAYLVKGYLRRWSRRPGGETFYRLAAEVDPNLAEAHHSLGAFEFTEARYDLAAEHARRAVALDPLVTNAHAMLTSQLGLLGQRDALLAAAAHAVEVLRNDAYAAVLPCRAHKDAGEIDLALACIRKLERSGVHGPELADEAASICATIGDRDCENRYLSELSKDGDRMASLWLAVNRKDEAGVTEGLAAPSTDLNSFVEPARLALAGLSAGRPRDALRLLRDADIKRAVAHEGARSPVALAILPTYVALERRYGTADVSPLVDIALGWSARFAEHGGNHVSRRIVRVRALAVAGRLEEALAELERAVAAFGNPFIVEDLERDPAFEGLRDDPRAQALLDRVRKQRAELQARLPETLKAAGL